MSDASNWRDVKAAARATDAEWDNPERVARRRRMREQMLASVSGAIGNIQLNVALGGVAGLLRDVGNGTPQRGQ
jgi:hypothetical protein